MKVVKSGSYVYTIECPHCGCVFEFLLKETEEFSTGDGMGGIKWHRKVTCPECEWTITYEEENKNVRTSKRNLRHSF